MSTSPRKRPASGVLSAVILLVIVVGFSVLFYVSGAWAAMFPPRAVTSQGRQISDLYTIIMVIAAVIFLVVESLIIWSVLRYRRRPGDTELPPQTHGNNLVEIVWTVIPTVIVGYMFVISMQTLGTVDAVSSRPDIHIRAVAGQFQWQFDYLDADGKTRLFTESAPLAENGGGMHVPVGRNVQVELTSPDVIHAFYVPQFLFKRDVVPGQVNRFEFTVDATDAGQTFRGQCAELCGIGHQAMHFDVVAVTQADYDAWIAKKIAEANATPAPRPSGAALLELTAKDIAYDKHELTVNAGQPFGIRFHNGDPAGVPHDVDLRQSDGKTVLQDKPTTDGGKEAVYDYTQLQPGTYTFICSVHPIPAMTGTLTVK
jgi:cytochrome c oxidase subunit 2